MPYPEYRLRRKKMLDTCARMQTSLDVADAAARASGVYLDEIRRTEHPVDHPIGFEFGAYLKALYFTISHV